jgi:PGF-pre-PGF domain-containing protein
MNGKRGFFFVGFVVILGLVFFSLVSSGQPEFGAGCTPGQSFSIFGQVYNTTYGNATSSTSDEISVNISIYNLSFSGFGEPSTIFVNQTNTSNTGNFSLGVASGNCAANYILKIVQYNSTSWNAQAIGATFPPLPIAAFTRVLDNGSFYLQNASTLNLSAINGSHPLVNSGDIPANLSFNYVLFDDALGFPIAENFQTRKFNDTVVVPRGRNYTVMFMRAPDFEDPSSFAQATPPVTYSLSADQMEGNQSTQYVVNVVKNLSFDLYYINGTINVTGNKTAVNMTNLVTKLGLAGMVPPNSEMSLGSSIKSITNRTGCNDQNCYLADYNLTVIGAAGNGIYQVLEWYAANTTATSDVGGDYFAYFNNFSVTGSVTGHNVVLRGLAGNVTTQNTGSSSITTRYVAINMTNEQGQPLDDAHTELKVDIVGHKTTLPTFRYMISQLSGGVVRLPILNDSNASLLVYNRRFAPKEIRLNITNASLVDTLGVKMQTFKPRRFFENGTVQEMNSSQGSDEFRIVFMQNSPACNVYNASVASCRLGNDDYDVGSFDPLKAMVAGKVNILNIVNTTGVITYFIGVDMLASGPPQSDMSERELRESVGTTRRQVWRFGSNAPDIFDKVFLGIPYNESKFNESALFNISFDYLLNEDNAIVWNATIYPNGTNIPDSYADYNISWLNQSAGGMRCVNETGLDHSIQQCYVNVTTNYIWMSLPHFSPDDDPVVEGDPDTTPPSLAPINVNASDSNSDGNIEINWTDPGDETGETYAVFRFSSNITVFNTSLRNMTTARVGEGITGFVDNTTSGDNATVYYYVVVQVDSAGNFLNASGQPNMSNSVNATANDTIIPDSPVLNVSVSSATATFWWKNVTLDVSGNSDESGLRYKLYSSPVNGSINFSALNVNDSTSGVFLHSTLASNGTTYTAPTSTGLYHFVLTTIDDRNNENLSFMQNGVNLNYVNVTLTVSAASSSSSSSGGGGGGGGGSPTKTPGVATEAKLWSKLSAGSSASMTISNVDIPFTSVRFSLRAVVTNAGLAVTATDSKPAAAKDAFPGTVYKYIEIKETNMNESDVFSASLKYRVERKWLTEQSALANDVELMRYSSGTWNALDSTIASSDAVYYYYEADSPGLSIFAIGINKPAEVLSEEPADEPDASDKNETGELDTAAADEQPAGRTKYLVFVVIGLLVGAVGVGVFLYRKMRGNLPVEVSKE